MSTSYVQADDAFDAFFTLTPDARIQVIADLVYGLPAAEISRLQKLITKAGGTANNPLRSGR